MADNRFVPPKSTVEVLETVPDVVLRRLKQYSGRLATEAVRAMEQRLPFFADLEASQRASVQLVVQAAVVNFVEWMRDPQSNVSYTAQAFEVVPQDLRRKIALRQSVEMVRVTMEYCEEVVPLLARSDEQLTALTAGILRYSRDLAFAAAHRIRRPGRGTRRMGHPDGGQRHRRRRARGHRTRAAVPSRRIELGRHRPGHRDRGPAASRSQRPRQ